MPNNIHDVFRDLVEVDGANTTRDVPGVIAYGLFWTDLEAWINHQIRNGGAHPSPADIDRHIQTNLTENYFRDLEGKALQLFGEAALAFLSDRIEAEKEAAVRNSILASIESYNQATLAEVTKGSSLWRQTGTALITAIVAPLLLGAILVAIQAYSRYSTPKDTASNITEHVDRTNNSEQRHDPQH